MGTKKNQQTPVKSAKNASTNVLKQNVKSNYFYLFLILIMFTINSFGQCPISATSTSICTGSSAILTAIPGWSDYSWSTGATTQSISVSPTITTTYTVTVGVPAYCTATITIDVNPTPPHITGADKICYGGSITLDAGSGYTSYLWSTLGTDESVVVSPTATTTYYLTVTDAYGCTVTAAQWIPVYYPPSPIIIPSGPTTFCSGGSVSLDAGTPFGSYRWNTGATTETISVSMSGIYIVTVTSHDGDNPCTATASISVTVDPYPSPSISIITWNCGGSITLDAGSGYSSYSWSSSLGTTETVTIPPAVIPMTYTVTVSNSIGCTGTASIYVPVTTPLNPVITPSGPTEFCDGGSVTLAVVPTFLTYIWNTGATTNSITVTSSGYYTVTVSNYAGSITCTSTVSIEVTVYPDPAPTIWLTGPSSFCPGGTVTMDPGIGYSAYLWSTGATTETISVSTSGTYSITVTESIHGCTGTASQIITVDNPAPTISTGGALTVFCTGGSVTLSSSPSASYIWSTGATTQSIVVTTSGTYTVTVTDANGCTGTASQTVIVTGSLSPTITSSSLSLCSGNDTLIASLGYSYTWSYLGTTTQSIIISSAGTYTVTVNDGGGCSGTASVIVTAGSISAPSITAIGSTTFCSGGSVTLEASSGYTKYIWSNSQTTQTIVVTTGGTYTVTVDNGGGCTATATIAVTVYTSPNPSSTITTSCLGGSVIIDAGSGYTHYAWSPSSSTTETITVSATGTYTVTVTASNGCTGTASEHITLPSPVATITSVGDSCGGGSVTLTANGGVYGAVYHYQWGSSTWSFTGPTTQTISISDPGTYIVTVTDANGCTATASITVTLHTVTNPVITRSGDSCLGGTVTLIASWGYAGYLWYPNFETSDTIEVNSSDTYFVIATDANGCTSTASVNVDFYSYPTPVIIQSGPSCSGSGPVTLSCGSYSSYIWNTSAHTVTITVSATGTYSVTVTDGHGCTGNTSSIITYTTSPVPTISGGGSLCTGGSLTLNAGAYSSYSWSTTATTSSVIITTAGTYTVTVTDVNGCTGTASQTVSSYSNPTPSITAGGPTTFCSGGSVSLDAGATYSSFIWNTGATTELIAATASGTYTVTVTDSHGCTGTTSKSVTVNPAPSPSIITSGIYCQGELTLTTGVFTSYLWSTTATTSAILILSSGTYTVTVTGADGCTGTATSTVTVNSDPSPTITYTGATTFCQGGSLLLDAGGSFTAYQWSNGASSETITATTGGTYIVTVTGAYGCTATASVVITVNPSPTPTITGSGVCSGGPGTLSAGSYSSYSWSTAETTSSINITTAGTYTVTVTDVNGCTGTAVYTTSLTSPTPAITSSGANCSGVLALDAGSYASYTWSPSGTSEVIHPTSSGTYSVTVTDIHGCTGSTSISVTLSSNPSPIISGGPATLCYGNTVTLDPGTFTSYLWSTGATSETISPGLNGTYVVTVTNSYGCTGTASKSVTVYTDPTPVITGGTAYCYGSYVVIGTSPFSSYFWSAGSATTQTITVSSPGSYSITVTDANGCTGTATQVITEISPISLTVNAVPPSICNGQTSSLNVTGGFYYFWSPSTNALTGTPVNADPSTTTTYTVTGYDVTEACSATATVTVTVHPDPTASITGSLCSSGSATIDAGALFSNYQWSNGGTSETITVTAAGTYFVTVSNSNGCTTTAQTTVTINTPPVISITGNTSLCGDTVKLDAGTWSHYSWTGGITTESISVFTPGTYTITITNSSGCTNSASITLNPGCPDIPCASCIPLFGPQASKTYMISAWVKEAGAPPSKTSYDNPQLIIKFLDASHAPLGPYTVGPISASGIIIDGWQRIESELTIPPNTSTAKYIEIILNCTTGNCYFDDIRFFPEDGSMKSYVYDPVNLRLVAELDERNYATIYEYDEEGKLVRVKKETERGIMTIKENKNSTVKKN